MNCTSIVRQYDIQKTIGVFFMPGGKPKKRYTGEFKEHVVKTMRTENLSCCETAR